MTDALAPPARGWPAMKADAKLRGVNLGGWLVLERWITPSLYADVEAEDEYTFCQMLGRKKASERLKNHRETWIVADFIDVVFHLFSDDARQYYDLDNLWGDAKIIPWQE